MDFLISVLLFTVSLILSFIKDISIILPLIIGMFSFSFTAFHRGYTIKSICKMIIKGMKKAFQLMPIFILIGIITATWRASGTIPFFVYYGTKLMNPHYFILFAFLLTCIVSFALGTSFGTVGTIGVVLIVLAKGGGVNTSVAAGAIISGALFGDRCSPTSSSANLVATITNTDLYGNIKRMFVTGAVPFLVTLIFYYFLSKNNPINITNAVLINEISHYFNLSFVTILPALIIFVLAFFKKNVKTSMFFSIITAIFICSFFQKMDPSNILNTMIFGFKLGGESSLAGIISGGGLFSMLRVSLIVLIASSYTGIFEETGMLNSIQGLLYKISKKIGTYMTTLLTSLVTGAFCCNQALSILLTHQLMNTIYAENGLPKENMAIDLENTAVMTAQFFPWSIAIAVPLATLSADTNSIIYAVYLFLIPLINILKISNFKSHFPSN